MVIKFEDHNYLWFQILKAFKINILRQFKMWVSLKRIF